MPAQIKAFIFDLDGVITDTAEYHYRSWQRLADEEGLTFTRQDNEKLRGVPRRESLRRLLKGHPIDEETAQAWMTRKNDYFHTYLREMTPENRLPGVTRFLDEAQSAGISLAIGSASRNVKPVLEKLQLLDLFDVIGDAYSVANNKPAPDIFVWVAGGLGVRVDEAVVFEDAEDGVNAALKAGFLTVGIGQANVAHAHIRCDDLSSVSVSEILSQLEMVRRD